MARNTASNINVRGVYFNDTTLDATVDALCSALTEKKQVALYTPNSEIVQACIDEPSLYDVINSAELIIPDGIGVVKAARILGTPFASGKIAGIEVGEAFVKRLSATEHTVFLLGGKPGVAEQAGERLAEKYPGIHFVGFHDGYFKKEGDENEEILRLVNESGAEVLFVCLGAPTQEKWIYQNRDRLPSVHAFLALGGSLDGYAGIVKRAPRIFIRLGFEWFYRLLCEPWRLRRMMKLPKFYFGTWSYKLTRSKRG